MSFKFESNNIPAIEELLRKIDKNNNIKGYTFGIIYTKQIKSKACAVVIGTFLAI